MGLGVKHWNNTFLRREAQCGCVPNINTAGEHTKETQIKPNCNNYYPRPPLHQNSVRSVRGQNTKHKYGPSRVAGEAGSGSQAQVCWRVLSLLSWWISVPRTAANSHHGVVSHSDIKTRWSYKYFPVISKLKDLKQILCEKWTNGNVISGIQEFKFWV